MLYFLIEDDPQHMLKFFCDTSGLLILLGLNFSAIIFLVDHIGDIAFSFIFVVMISIIEIAEIHEEVLSLFTSEWIIGLIFW